MALRALEDSDSFSLKAGDTNLWKNTDIQRIEDAADKLHVNFFFSLWDWVVQIHVIQCIVVQSGHRAIQTSKQEIRNSTDYQWINKDQNVHNHNVWEDFAINEWSGCIYQESGCEAELIVRTLGITTSAGCVEPVKQCFSGLRMQSHTL